MPPAKAAAEAMDVPVIRDLMWRGAGLFRARLGLLDTLQRLDADYVETRRAIDPLTSDAEDWHRFNLLTVGRLITRAALRREESRGGHYRQDFPTRDDLHWKVHLIDEMSTLD
jgi:L-aspartate oxidase